MKEPRRPATHKSYVYVFRRDIPGKEIVLYEYNATDHKHVVNDLFAGYSGTLHCDPFFNLLFTPTFDAFPDPRRKFEPIANATQGNGLAKQAMAFDKRIYCIERHAKMSVTQRYELRQL